MKRLPYYLLVSWTHIDPKLATLGKNRLKNEVLRKLIFLVNMVCVCHNLFCLGHYDKETKLCVSCEGKYSDCKTVIRSYFEKIPPQYSEVVVYDKDGYLDIFLPELPPEICTCLLYTSPSPRD